MDEIKLSFKKEADYLAEAQNTIRYRELAKNMLHIRVPQVFSEVSTQRVLTLSFEQGLSLSVALKKNLLSSELRQHYAGLFLNLYLTEFCSWGFVQTDPNLGNFLLDLTTRDLVLLDFGATREFSPEFRRQYAQLVMASVNENREKCLELAQILSLLDPRESEDAKDTLFELLKLSMKPFRKTYFELNSDEYTDAMKSVGMKLVRELRFSPPPRDLIFLHRKLGGIFQILRRLEVTLDLRPFLHAFEAQSK
jgi:aarF domain-containing kinase